MTVENVWHILFQMVKIIHKCIRNQIAKSKIEAPIKGHHAVAANFNLPVPIRFLRFTVYAKTRST